MNKIERMLQELCPEGVEYKKLGEVCVFQRGSTITAKEAVEGDVPVIAGGQKPAYYHNVANRQGKTVVVAGSGAYAGFVTYWEIPIFVSDAFSVNPHGNLDTKYLYYYLKNIQENIHATKKGSGVPHVHGSSIAKFEIPIPPLLIQEEIVRILDHFTELTAELQAELQARQEQYEYYRNRLLMFDAESVSCIKMSEIMDISRGASPRPISLYITESAEGVNWIKIGDVSPTSKYVTSTKEKITKAGAKESKYLQKGDFILSNSMSFGRPYILKIDGCIHDGWISLSNFDKSVTSDYLYHILRTNAVQRYWKQNAGKGTVSNLNADIVRNTVIPIPPISEQKRIVSILNKFETLVNDLSQGLPAEIAAVQEQYEYYRNKLLTFNHIKSN